jgi:exopolysaccharide biosynthesis polyprenyl glycosylphosphotransferase
MSTTAQVRKGSTTSDLGVALREQVAPRTVRPRQRRVSLGRWGLVSLDCAAALGASWLVAGLRGSGDVTALLLALVWLALLVVTGAYRTATVHSWPDQVRRIGLAGIAMAAILPGWSEVHGYAAALSAALLTTATVTVRGVSRAFQRCFGAATASMRIVVAGHRRDVDRIVAELKSTTFPRYDVVDSVGTRSGDLSRICESVALTRPDAVLLVPCRHVGAAAVRRLGWQLESSRTRLMLATSLVDVSPSRARLAVAGSLQLVDVRQATLAGGRRLLKEVLERVVAALALLVLLPLFLLLVVVIRLESEGPAVFRQTRVGKDSVPFTILKFRTMRPGAHHHVSALRAREALDPAEAVLFKMRADPRVTRVGAVLRRYSLDELPQLINVVLGDMSLVGPRPSLPEEVARYQPDVRRRLAVKPGITGLWQVSGRSDLSWEQTVRLDLWYVDNWSLVSDLAIVLRTLRAVVTHRGAY